MVPHPNIVITCEKLSTLKRAIFTILSFLPFPSFKLLVLPCFGRNQWMNQKIFVKKSSFGHFEVVLCYLLKAFDILPHNHLIAKHAYVIDYDSLSLIHSVVSQKKAVF